MRTELLKGTCTPKEKQALLAIAAQDCKSQAEVLRDLIRKEARRCGLWPIEQRAGRLVDTREPYRTEAE
jgi:hypothetical protein